MCLIISYFECNSRDGERDSWTPINEITSHILYKQENIFPIMGSEEIVKNRRRRERNRESFVTKLKMEWDVDL